MTTITFFEGNIMAPEDEMEFLHFEFHFNYSVKF